MSDTTMDDFQTDTISTSQHSIGQLIGLLNDGCKIECDRVVIETDQGTLEIDSYADLRIKEVDQ